MSDQRLRFVTGFMLLNVLFGTMMLMSAVFFLTFGTLRIVDLGAHVPLKVGISFAGAVLGVSSGVGLLKGWKLADLLAIGFSVALASFEGLLLFEDRVPAVVGWSAVLYAAASAGYFIASRFRRRNPPRV
jgi:hypothetical protein